MIEASGAVGDIRESGPPAVRLLRLPIGDRSLRLRLHLEGSNKYGSVKDRTARALLDSLEAAGKLRAGGHVIESTSGNLGLALAGLCAERGYRCTLVVDESAAAFSLRQMAALGAELIHVPTDGPLHGVHARLQAVRDFLTTHPHAVWTNQYSNPAGPAIHAGTTGPALAHQPGLPAPQAVMVPVSTGGVLAGVATYLRASAAQIAIWAVDAVGSAATGGVATPRPTKLPGFGSARRSDFLHPSHFDRIARASDADAAAACRMIFRRTGIALGGSAGAAVLVAVRAAGEDPSLSDVACLCPDGGDRYQSLIYDPDLTAGDQGQLDPAVAAMRDLRPGRTTL